ncbi:hypothetical protein ASPTUDRAFT_635088 [Aspergillus tubingensis CBS 134.48]|uniref:ATPase AAA-type core domain-containing protein n=1 Tax=Aspergillus tubingensis (strain CBS 134.48) TaxID=767770 RepID=A0A1L9N3X3_ASPTC|nr:hypothetical protein ASPTUDRAFT_635088 [Aspergillus tubingensis CBS 134.48]
MENKDRGQRGPQCECQIRQVGPWQLHRFKSRRREIPLRGIPQKTHKIASTKLHRGKAFASKTCGDLGLEVSEGKRSLKEIFHVAPLWDCILLLDEADFFTSQRSHQDLQRNTFLTTNRVDNADEAFKSRVHISLYYPPLSLGQIREFGK